MIWDRKTRWKQFLLIVVAIGLFFTGNTAWWVVKDDDGHDCYTWQTKVLGVVLGVVVAIIALYGAYHCLLAWEIGWSGPSGRL